jgi:hypothetical protein
MNDGNIKEAAGQLGLFPACGGGGLEEELAIQKTV